MHYPKLLHYQNKLSMFNEYIRLKHEYGAEGLSEPIATLEAAINNALEQIRQWPECEALRAKEPDDYESILQLRPQGPRRIWQQFDRAVYMDKLEGALLGRMAGCTLGAVVENWRVADMENWAAHIGDTFPPVDYWSAVPYPYHVRYDKSTCLHYTRGHIDGVPVDDDVAYTLLGLLIAEDHGLDFTTADVAQAWVRYLPYACTAEDVALRNLKAGVAPEKAAEIDNPFCQWIGADIRADPFGYLAPGYPEKAAAMAYQDAYISHRRNGIYGEMFFAAAIAAAFTTDNVMKALHIGLTEIPQECTLYQDLVWALGTAPTIKNYKDARKAVDERFAGMHSVHTNNNACLTVFGLAIGGSDVTKVIAETVAMGLDNDCTAATAGSIAGAVAGRKGIAPQWTKGFNNKVRSYLIGPDSFAIDDLINRFTTLAVQLF